MLKKITVPRPLMADAYTVTSDSFASKEARTRSVYNYCNRYSPTKAWPEVAQDKRMVFFGLTQYLRNVLIEPVTYDEVVEAAHFMESAHSFGGMLPFPLELWKRVVFDYGGRLPIKIEALREGSTFFPNEPVIQVTSLDEGFGELAAWVEAVMVGTVSIATARATLTRHWLERLREWVAADKNTNDPAVLDTTARWMIHDFGMRASSCAEESELLGLAHLLTFHGTDTFNAAYLAIKYGANRPTGTSILALAHRNVQGHKHEVDAFNDLHDATQYSKLAIGSYVADCYNFDKALKELVKLAKRDSKSVVVVRPDSGPYVKNVIDICKAAYDSGLFSYKDDGMSSAKNLRFIQGDSMTPEKVNDTFQEMNEEGFSPTEWGIFGVGGYLRNNVTRDSLSSAYKLASVGNHDKKVCKLSETHTKLSIPGKTVIDHRNKNGPLVFWSENHEYDEKVVYYDGTNKDNPFGSVCEEPFAKLQERCINEFDSWSNINPIILNQEISEWQTQFYNSFRG